MIILQISPEFDPGTGVGGVAHNLEEQWRAKGHEVRRFGLEEARASWLSGARSGIAGRLRHAARVVWFSTVGTVLARRAVAGLPVGSIAVCHNDALSGQVYVNHGILQTAMRARGRYWWRMVRNPLHVFTAFRDRLRYQGNSHRAVVNLTCADDRALHAVYPRVSPPTVVIGNGVDTVRFRPPTIEERAAARERLGVDPEDLLTVFVGNEYERKGLFPLVEALSMAGGRHHLVVVGGTSDMVARLLTFVRLHGIEERVHAVGRQDPLGYLWAADLLAQPSAYESYGLVVTEALAAGVPVISTRVGVAPDIIDDGVNGFLTGGTAVDLLETLGRLATSDHDAMRAAARQSALAHTWDHISDAYLDLFAQMVREKVV